jgi:ABC-type glutathione transport system ATPase component
VSDETPSSLLLSHENDDATRVTVTVGGPSVHQDGEQGIFGAHRAVYDVDLDIRRGEFFTMLGPSGSGKTTLLRLIAGFEVPDAGTISLRGTDVTGLPPYQRGVNTVFQDYALFPHFTSPRTWPTAARAQGAKAERNDERVDAALDMVRMTEFARAAPRNSPAANANASRWRAPSSTSPRCSCSTNRWARSTSNFARRCRWSSSASSDRSASPSSTSRTTRRRRSR